MESASTSTERTPLTGGNPQPTYVFHANRIRQHKARLRHFQCCVCAALLGLFIIVLVVTISFAVEDSNNSNSTAPNLTLIPPNVPRPDQVSYYSLPTLLNDDWEVAYEAGAQALNARDRYENLASPLKQDTPSFRAQKAVATTSRATALARVGYATDYATRSIVKRKNITPDNFSHWSVAHFCPGVVNATWWPTSWCISSKAVFPCAPAKYRTDDGTCNNPLHPRLWGVALTPFRRALPPNYADGVSAPRRAVDGGELPSAREVSVVVHRPVYRDDHKFTAMLAVWGQFMDHDVTATALSQGANGSAISCCPDDITPGLIPHPECFPVRLAPGDPFYHNYNLTCMEFVRSAPAPTCSFGPREQLNQVSAYLDGSAVYGSDRDLMNQLREHVGGKLKMFVTPDNRTLLPVSTDPNDGCNREEMNKKGRYCFMSGDARSNENLHLTTMHLLWARQHNRIAKQLQDLHPSWSDETLFQESRRIVSAQIQHITYNEFLPVLLGPKLMSDAELNPLNTGYYTGYNASIDASIANEFAAAAFRFAHTLLPGLMKALKNDTSNPEYIALHKILFNPYELYNPGALDSAIRGATQTHIESSDVYFSKEVKEHLFENPFDFNNINKSDTAGKVPLSPCGLDLVSLNIQRGRDHGLQTYPYWREHCGLSRPNSFTDMMGYMDSDSLTRISRIYKSVNDIDLYTGALSEIPRKGGILGETATCLIVDQFIRLKRGDRFWYETGEFPQGFTIAQLNEIRKTSLASIICDNSDNITIIQPQVMYQLSDTNAFVNCSQLRYPNLTLWKDEIVKGKTDKFPHVKLSTSASIVSVRD